METVAANIYEQDLAYWLAYCLMMIAVFLMAGKTITVPEKWIYMMMTAVLIVLQNIIHFADKNKTKNGSTDDDSTSTEEDTVVNAAGEN